MSSRCIVVGVGNPILSDDAAGIAVARLVHEKAPEDRKPDLLEAPVGGFELVERLVGYEKAIVIDAILTPGGRAGDFYQVVGGDLAASVEVEPPTSAPMPSMTHQIGLMEGLELARRLGMNIPAQLYVYAVEVADPYTFGTEMTEAVRAAVPRVAEEILKSAAMLPSQW